MIEHLRQKVRGVGEFNKELAVSLQASRGSCCIGQLGKRPLYQYKRTVGRHGRERRGRSRDASAVVSIRTSSGGGKKRKKACRGSCCIGQLGKRSLYQYKRTVGRRGRERRGRSRDAMCRCINTNEQWWREEEKENVLEHEGRCCVDKSIRTTFPEELPSSLTHRD